MDRNEYKLQTFEVRFFIATLNTVIQHKIVKALKVFVCLWILNIQILNYIMVLVVQGCLGYVEF